MWDAYTPPPKPPIYRRAWFLALLLSFVGLGAIASFVLIAELSKWERKAREFDYSKLSDMESASIIYDRNNQVFGRIFIQNRDQVPLAELSPQLLKAVVGAEDARFYQHDGVDYFGIARAMVKNYQAGRTRQGASTLTQQLARNTFPKELPSNDRSYERKMLEIGVAKEIERRCSKQQILELYLNRVFFGSGFYGAEAASRGYFGKHAKDLTLSESATLTGLLKSPNNLSPWRNRQACIDQRNYVLQRLLELKMITQEEYDSTRAEDLIVKNRRPIHQESYAADLVAQQVEKLVGYENAVSEGYRIYTTIDAEIQKTALNSLREQLSAVERHEGFDHQTYAQYDQMFRAFRRKQASGEADANAAPPEPEYLQGSVVVLENSTGGILALVGGRDIAHSEFNRAISARRPAGTAFKPLVYAAAFEKGMFPGTLVQDSVIDNRQVMIGGTTGILGEWGPERVDNKYEGPISARTALVKSKNAATVRLGMMTGIDKVTSLAKSAGVESPLRPYPATYLGSSEVTPMEMTLANTLFPNGGARPEHTFIVERIEEKSGRVLYEAKKGQTRVIKPTTAYEVHSCLADVLERGTGEKAFTEYGLKRYPVAGKTGTAYNFTDVWFVGYSSEVTCSVWAGFDKPRTTIYRGAFSNEIALPVWANVMKSTFEKHKPHEIAAPKGIIKCEICSASGLLATNKCFETTENKETGEKVDRRTTYFEIATDAQAPKDGCDVHGDTPRALTKTEPTTQGNVPRAVPAVDLSALTPIALKAPTVIGNDPYNSVQSVNSALAIKALNNTGQVAPMDNSGKVQEVPKEDQVEVRQAIPVKPLEQAPPAEQSPIKLDPPPPLQF
ncbi:transglycosylase domain-containing protein [Verrucomicrobiota bacterium sgz303538]